MTAEAAAAAAASSWSSCSGASTVMPVRIAQQQERRRHYRYQRHHQRQRQQEEHQKQQQQQQEQEQPERRTASRCTMVGQQQQPDAAAAAAAATNRRRRLLPAAVLAVSGALLVLSPKGGIASANANANGSSNLRLASSRQLSAAITATGSPPRKLVNGDAIVHQKQDGNGQIAPAISETVRQLARPFLDDEASIFAFDATDPRPVINTFFAIADGRRINRAYAETLAVWKRAWSGAGWNPRILNVGHAKAHPDYAAIDAKLKEVPLGANPDYDKACYLRHFAMAALSGGWMTDYDTIPLNMNAEVYGGAFPNEGQFTAYEGHVPSLVVGSGEEWDRVSKALLREGVDAGANEDAGYVREGKPRLFSDMYALEALVRKDEIIVNKPHSVFQAHATDRTTATEIVAWDLDVMAEHLKRGASLQQHCEETKSIMALHFSHSATSSLGYLPDDRPILIAAFLDRWSKLCGGPAFHFDGSAEGGTGASPEAEAEAEAEASGIAADVDADAEESPSTADAKATPSNSDSLNAEQLSVDLAVYDQALRRVDDPASFSPTDKMFFYHVPKSGGTSIEIYYHYCLGLNMPHVDANKGIAPQDFDEAVILKTNMMHHISLFQDRPIKARAFGVFRHPVEAVQSEYYYLQVADWEGGYNKNLGIEMTVEEYAASHPNRLIQNVLMMRGHGTTNVITDEDLQKAKLILRDYVLVGLMDRMEESLDRFDTFIGVSALVSDEKKLERCRQEGREKVNNSNKHPKLVQDSQEWQQIAAHNQYDIALYEYAVQLFAKQGENFSTDK